VKKKVEKLTPKHMALLAIVDAMRADMFDESSYLNRDPNTHEELAPRTAVAVKRTIHHIVDSLNKRLPVWARRP
jgi:hypothetical protein